MKRVTNVIAKDDKDTVRVTITTQRKSARYESHDLEKHHNDLVDGVHAELNKKFRVRDITTK